MPEQYNLFGNFEDKNVPLHSLFAPSHEEATERISMWAKKWNIPNTHLFDSDKASHKNALAKLKNEEKIKHTIAFVGHGCTSELFTHISFGKQSKVNSNEGCLLDCEDIDSHSHKVSIIAWACSSAKEFGVKVGKCSTCNFFGFTEKIGLVIYDTKSETLWSNLIKEVFSRIISKNKIEHKDKIWFKDRINEIIKKIQKGEIDTGEFNEMNIFYLDRLNDSVEIYCN